MADLSGEAIGKLSPQELVAVLEKLQPDAAARLDVDAIGRAVDPKLFGRDDLADLLSHLDRLAVADLGQLEPQTFARLISRASEKQLRAVLSRPALRTTILGEIFRRMQAHLRVERARSVRAVIHWRFPEGSDHERYETVIADGVCTTVTGKSEKPRVTITMHPYEFLRLITGNASAPVLFMTGRLKVRGDLAFAAGLMSLFDLPRA
jgi:putative sterol carrier protein